VNEKTFINKFHVSNAEASLSELMSCWTLWLGAHSSSVVR
jgi:hypothetical protein